MNSHSLKPKVLNPLIHTLLVLFMAPERQSQLDATRICSVVETFPRISKPIQTKKVDMKAVIPTVN